MQMDGIQGYRGWSWIFIIEVRNLAVTDKSNLTIQGILTCIIAIVGFFTLVDFPDNAQRHKHFLTPQEVRFCIARINRDRGDAVAEPFSWGRFLRPAADLKVWGFGLIFGMSTTVSYSLAFFLPLILNKGLGFSIGASQCLVAPPYAAAAIWMYATACKSFSLHCRKP